MQRHNLDVLSLFSGLVFVAVAVIGLSGTTVISASDLRWLGPLAIVAFGVVLVATAGGGRRADAAADGEPRGVSADETQPLGQDG